MPKTTSPQAKLFANAVIEGKFYRFGEELPFTVENLPQTLKPFLLDDSQVENKGPARANFEPGQVYTEGVILTRTGAAQASRLQAMAEHEDWAKEVASEPLSPEIEKALQSEHDLRIGKALALAQYKQENEDRAFENALKQADDQHPQLFVRRGSARHYIEVERANKLTPGEHCFVRRPNGRFESAGIINSACELPEPEIQT